MANALATDIFCEVNSSVVFRKKFSGWAGHIHFDRGIFVNGGVRQSKIRVMTCVIRSMPNFEPNTDGILPR